MMSTVFTAELSRLRNLRSRIAEISRGDTGQSAGANDMIQRVLFDFREKARCIEAAWPNERLLAEYRIIANEQFSAELDDILSEIRHRNIVV